jgi:hypothetical protein
MRIGLNKNLKITLQSGTIINVALYVFDKYFIVPAWIVFPFLQSRLFSWCRDKKSIIGCRLERNGWIFVFIFIYLVIFIFVYIINKFKSRRKENE